MRRNNCAFFLSLTVLVLAGRLHGYSQNASKPEYPSVIGVAGGVHHKLPIGLDWTLGEIFVESAITGNQWHTQGFHQPFLSAKTLFPSGDGGYDIKIFPNPTSQLLNVYIRTTEEELLDMQLIDLTGKIIYKKEIPPHTAEMQFMLKHIPEGMYILSFVNPSGYRIHSFKIVKL